MHWQVGWVCPERALSVSALFALALPLPCLPLPCLPLRCLRQVSSLSGRASVVCSCIAGAHCDHRGDSWRRGAGLLPPRRWSLRSSRGRPRSSCRPRTGRTAGAEEPCLRCHLLCQGTAFKTQDTIGAKPGTLHPESLAHMEGQEIPASFVVSVQRYFVACRLEKRKTLDPPPCH